MRRVISFLTLSILAVFSQAAISAELTYSNLVTCNANDSKCDAGLSVSGAETSSIVVQNVPSGPADVVFFVGEGKQVSLQGCTAPGGTIKIVVQKNRHVIPVTLTSRFHNVQSKPTCDDLRFVTEAATPDITFSVGGKPFIVPIRNQKWWLESGGVYTYSWARDEELVTQSVEVNNATKTRVLARRSADRLGPMTGVTFVFHPGDFPELGWEFATATSAGRTHYFLGGTVRLIQFNDRALLTIGGGVSHVSVNQFPDITISASGPVDYDPADPRLTGRPRYVNRPYISLGLGINIGSSAATKASQ